MGNIAPMRVDLHSHSHYSDGDHPPAYLISRARENGISHLALTDHDSLAGCQTSDWRASTKDITLIDGVEISTLQQGRELHIIGLGIDTDEPRLCALLASQQERRRQRMQRYSRLLDQAGLPGLPAYLDGLATESPGRAHVAEFLVIQGRCRDRRRAFKSFLAPRQRLYVAPDWCSPASAIEAIHGAGGLAILAHPHRYSRTGRGLVRLLEDTVENAFDNCVDIANASQTDTDHNGCGDSCTANISCDANGDTSVGAQDFTILRMQFGNTPPSNTSADCNGDTSVGSQDFTILRMQFGNTVGPSGITTAQCDPASCRCTPQ